MANFADTAKQVATATQPREFDLSTPITLEEMMEKLNARASAFQMPFKIKGGIMGEHIAFEKEPNLEVGLNVFVKDGTHVRILAAVSQNATSINGMRVDKNSVLRRGVTNMAVEMPLARGKYIDDVKDTIQKILNGEEVPDYVAPATPEEAPGAEPPKNWLATLLLCILLGGLGIHRFYVGKIGTGILWMCTGGCFGIGWLVDLVKIITGKFTDKKGNLIQKA